MIKKNDINDILDAMRKEYPNTNERDIAFIILCNEFSDRNLVFNLAYGYNSPDVEDYISSDKISTLRSTLEPYGIGIEKQSITRDENTSEMVKLLKKIQKEFKSGTIEAKDALKMESDIRVKLQAKFDVGDNKEQKRIIVVPQKHDLICPHTQRECCSMPTKEACITYYNLKEK